MSLTLVIIVVFVVGVVLFFALGNRMAARAHARFQMKDVAVAIAEVLSPDSKTHDTFDLFLACPIDDPYLESIRQQCLLIIRETDPAPLGQDLSDEGFRRITAVLNDLRDRMRAMQSS